MKKQVKKVKSKVGSLFNYRQAGKAKRNPPGQIPGTAVYTGVQKLDEVLITVRDFDESHFDSIDIEKIEKSAPYLEDKSKTWIQVRGLHDVEKLQTVWDYFDLHPLIQEDIVNTTQRPKVEFYNGVVFIVMRMIILDKAGNGESASIETEQISIALGNNFVLSFEETDDPVFAPVLKRLENSNTRLRSLGSDYLAYALIDNVVDHYFNALDLIAEKIEELEEQIIEEPRQEHLPSIHALRRDMIQFRKSVWSLRDGINSLVRDDVPLISDEVRIFLRDVYDHLIQVIDSIETSREMVYGLYDMYMSGLSNRMNEVMKVLTIIATIFIPLTFVAGIYGMNFDPGASPYNMPELSWYWGYPASLVVMFVIAIIMVIYFRRKHWI